MASSAIEGGTQRGLGARTWQIPPVADRWWRWVLALWLAVFALAVAVEIVGSRIVYERNLLRPFSHVGLGWRSAEGVVTLRPPHTDEGKRSGLKGGETILAVNGKPVGNRVADMQEVDRLLVGPEGSLVVLRTRDTDGAVRDHRLTRREAHADANFAGSGITSRQAVGIAMVTLILPDLFLLMVSALLMRSRRREAVGILFAFGFLAIVATGPASSFLVSEPWQVALHRTIVGLGLPALGIAILAFPDGRVVGRWRQAIVATILLVGALTVAGLNESEMSNVATSVILFGLPAVALFFRARRLGDGPERRQLRYALFGFSVSLACLTIAILLNVLLPDDDTIPARIATWVQIGSMILSALSVIALAGGLLLSLLRYRLYDVDTVISRSAAYGLMTVGFVAAFAGLENVLEQAAQAYFSENAGKAAGAISAALAAGLIGPMHNRIHGWTEQRFRKGLATMRRDLPNTIDDLRETATFDELAAAVEPRIARGVSADWVRLRPANLLGAGDIDLRGELEREVATPDGRVLALLEVGPRPDGSAHGKDEREAIDALVEPLARALMVVERREAKEKALDTRIGALEAALATLIRSPRKKPA